MRFLSTIYFLSLTASCIGEVSESVSLVDFDEEKLLPEDIQREVYVVQKYPVHDDDYKEFVYTFLKSRLETDGHVYVKAADEELKLVQSTETMNNITLFGQTENVFKDVAEVVLADGFRWNIFLMLREEIIFEDGVDSVLALVHANNARINIVTMETEHHVQTSTRWKRQTGGQPSAFQQIATASGGMVITTTKNNILAVSQLLKQAVKSNHVDIMRFQWPGSKAGKYFLIPVDDTMTQMTLQIQTPSARPIAMLNSPNGLPLSPTAGKLLGNALEIFEFNITKATDIGGWKVLKIGRGDWDVEVTGQSPVGFTFEFMEPGRDGFGMYPLNGMPIAGRTYQIVIRVPNYAMIKSVNVMLPLGGHNIPVGMPTTIHSVGGRRGKDMFTANMTMPAQDFRVAIDATGMNNEYVRRLAPVMVFPSSVDLYVPSTLGILYVNENATIPFTVVNMASTIQDVFIQIEDSEGFRLPIRNLFYTMKSGESLTKYFEIYAGSLSGVTECRLILQQAKELTQIYCENLQCSL